MKTHTPSRLCGQTLRKAADDQPPLVIAAASSRNAKRWNSNLTGSCHQAVASASAILRRHIGSADHLPSIPPRNSSVHPRIARDLATPPLALGHSHKSTLSFIEFRGACGFAVCAKRGKVCVLIPSWRPSESGGKVFQIKLKENPRSFLPRAFSKGCVDPRPFFFFSASSNELRSYR
jgi:hypothetical protein